MNIQDGSVCVPFTGTTYSIKYFKPIPKKLIKIPQQLRRRIFFSFHNVLNVSDF